MSLATFIDEIDNVPPYIKAATNFRKARYELLITEAKMFVQDFAFKNELFSDDEQLDVYYGLEVDLECFTDWAEKHFQMLVDKRYFPSNLAMAMQFYHYAYQEYLSCGGTFVKYASYEQE